MCADDAVITIGGAAKWRLLIARAAHFLTRKEGIVGVLVSFIGVLLALFLSCPSDVGWLRWVVGALTSIGVLLVLIAPFVLRSTARAMGRELADTARHLELHNVLGVAAPREVLAAECLARLQLDVHEGLRQRLALEMADSLRGEG